MIVSTNVSIGGGEQPALFAPVVTGGVNTISWANNTQNGGFAVTITSDVDGTPVTSPLTITEDMDGSTLTITASAENFESASSIITLSYLQSNSSLYALDAVNATGNANELFDFLFTQIGRWATVVDAEGNEANFSYLHLSPNGNKQSVTITDQSHFVANSDYADVGTGFYKYRYGVKPQDAPSDLFGWKDTLIAPVMGIQNSVSGTIIIYDVTAGELFRTISVNANSESLDNTSLEAIYNSQNYYTQGHYYTIITNLTFNPLS